MHKIKSELYSLAIGNERTQSHKQHIYPEHINKIPLQVSSYNHMHVAISHRCMHASRFTNLGKKGILSHKEVLQELRKALKIDSRHDGEV